MGKSVWEIFNEETPEVAEAYIQLSSAINKDGVLDDKTRSLILVGIFSTIRDPIAFTHFTRLAFNAGASKKEIQAAALLAFNTGVSSAELSIPLIKKVADSL
jgi:alkylhydroperoxidase/carboxymuconolactone decarboxylase family protein YurZ